MSETLVAVARQPQGLMAVVSLAEQEESGTRCAVVHKRIEETKGPVSVTAQRAAEAWGNLSRARLDEPQSIAWALTVLLDTVPLWLETGGHARTPLVVEPRRASAAHPRGWDGPRRRCLPAEDLRAALCTRSAWPVLRSFLRKDARRVFRLLRRAGYDGEALDPLVEARDPYLAYHHRVPDAPGLAAFSGPFRTAILPLLRSRGWGEIRRGLALYWAVDLERDAGLLAWVVRLLAQAPIHGLEWWELVSRQAPESRATFVRLLLESGAQASNPAVLPEVGLDFLAAVQSPLYEDRLAHLFAGLRQGVPAKHLIQALRLAHRFAPAHRFVTRWSCRPLKISAPRPGTPPDLEARLVPILLHIADAVQTTAPELPIRLWEDCSRRADLLELLSTPSLLRWSGEVTSRFLEILLDDESQLTVARKVRAAENLLGRTSSGHHVQILDGLARLFRCWPRPETFEAHFEAAAVLLARLSGLELREGDGCAWAIALFVEAAAPRATARLQAAPERSLSRLQRALHSDSGVGLLLPGLGALTKHLGRFVVEAFLAHPEALLGAARLLGGLSAPRRVSLLKAFRSHPLMQRRLLKSDLHEICARIENLMAPGLPNPVPRRLRDHLRGTAPLGAPSVERHRQTVLRGLLPLKLGLLRRVILQDLGRGLDPPEGASGKEGHALRMLGCLSSNRRLLRRLLRVAPDARRAFLLEHPANVDWLRRHRQVAPSLWTGAIPHALESPGQDLRLAIETDPLEVLRLGTAVGSCLSVGGPWQDSAVAVMADVNKQAVFARRRDGTFAARQIIAITEDDRLVFFPVYPKSADQETRDLFLRFDLSLADAMGLQPFREPSEQGYAIARILGRYFYDDGLWDPFFESPPAAPSRRDQSLRSRSMMSSMRAASGAWRA